MIGFSSKCPLSLEDRVNIERRMFRLRDWIGDGTIRAADILIPTEHDFPTINLPLHQRPQAVTDELVQRLGFSRSIQTSLIPNEFSLPEVIVDSEQGTIQLQQFVAEDPLTMVATLSRSIATMLLAGSALASDYLDEAELALLTELTLPLLGLGLFVANSRLCEYSEDGDVNDVGHGMSLTSQHYGYALAITCWFRGENPGRWKQYLRLDAREALTQGHRFLLAGETAAIYDSKFNGSEIRGLWEERLCDSDPAMRVDALWDLFEHSGPIPNHLQELIPKSLQGEDAFVVAMALQLCCAKPELSRALLSDIARHLFHSSPRVRIQAISCIENIEDRDPILPELANVIRNESDDEITHKAIQLIEPFADRVHDNRFVTALFDRFQISFRNDDDRQGKLILSILNQVCDVEKFLHSRYGNSSEHLSRIYEWFPAVQQDSVPSEFAPEKH